jgi:CubicO group peptidase (beta-lactamase class C family)
VLLIDPVLPPALDGLRVEVDLLGQRFDIRYRVRGAGCGVDALQLDGHMLAFGEEANPYRRGAARVALSDLAAEPTAMRREHDDSTSTSASGKRRVHRKARRDPPRHAARFLSPVPDSPAAERSPPTAPTGPPGGPRRAASTRAPSPITLQAGEALPALRALLCARDGVLVAERYYGGADANGLRAINSATKSVCSMLVGLALRDGRLKSLDQTVAQLLPEAVADAPDSPAASVTLRQILSGRTGLAYDPMRYRELIEARPLVRHALTRPAEPVAPPGWSYNDAMVALVAPILARVQGADLATLAARQLFAPLGIERFDWQRDRDGQPLAPGGLALRPRDLLKLAALMADGGAGAARRCCPQAWVAESLAPKGPATWRARPLEDVGYGFLWFTGRLHGQRVAWAWATVPSSRCWRPT